MGRTSGRRKAWGVARLLESLESRVLLSGVTTHLVFTLLPVNGTADTLGNVTVTVEDQHGNTIASDTSNVTLALGSKPKGATLGGTLTIQVSNGTATFSDLTLETPGNYSLKASDVGLKTVTSKGFKVSPGAATQIVFVPAQVADQKAGTKFNVTAAVEDDLGNVVTANNSNVTFSAGLQGSGTLAVDLTVKAKNGEAAFKNILLNTPGMYSLQAAGANLTAATSTIGVSGLVFTMQPTGNVAGAVETIQVTNEDGAGNPVVTDQSQVTLKIASGPASGNTLAKVNAVDGVATFTIPLTKAGTMSLKATDGNLTSGLSDSFTIDPGPAARLKIVSVFPQNTGMAPSGGTFGPVVVDVLDAFGNLVTGASATLAQFPESSNNSNGTIWSSIGPIISLPAVGTPVTQAITNATGIWEGSDGTNFSILVSNGTFNNNNAITASGGGGIRTTNGTSGNAKTIKASVIQFSKALNNNSIGWTISGNFSVGDIVTQTTNSGTATGVWEAPQVNGNITNYNVLVTSGNVSFDNTDTITGPTGALTSNGTTAGNVTSSGSISLTLSPGQSSPVPPIQQTPLISASASPAQGVATFSNLTVTPPAGSTVTTLTPGFYWLEVTAPGLTGEKTLIFVH